MSIQRALKIHSQDRVWLFIPFIILGVSFLFGLTIGLLIPGVEKILISGFSYILVYMFVMGVAGFNQTFAYAMGMSVRRTDYFISFSLTGLRSSLLFAILYIVLAVAEHFTQGWGNTLIFFKFPYLNDGNILEQLVIYFLGFVNFFFLGLFIAIFTKRYALKGLLILGLSLLFLITIAVLLTTYYEAWVDLFQWFAQHTAFQLSMWLIPLSLLYAIVSFLMIRRTAV
ncbi:hypothetical protein MUB24_09225 [Lederbergia sp. NSJ-179]|uniref:hypothetical protein n=1 Tax=Lederbergia sp. NSJ-179 TaxID=2931402 RepID=UPI001FD3D240|nr:hypothetical protein [Lederbergia sp. NSJ-179]MCJ7841075.1 hypothetical protein [Lederbergia sp. NSJ-179]